MASNMASSIVPSGHSPTYSPNSPSNTSHHIASEHSTPHTTNHSHIESDRFIWKDDTCIYKLPPTPLLPPSPALTAGSILEEDLFDIRQHPKSHHRSRPSLTESLLDKVKLPPLLTRASTVSSRAGSPTRGNRSPTRPSTPLSIVSSASRAPTRSRHSPSKSLFENILSSYSSPGPEDYPAAEDFEMESSFTRSPTSISRNRQNSAASNTTFASTVGEKFTWLKSRAFSSTAQRSSTLPPSLDAELIAADPLINLDVTAALFPDGPSDPLDPSSFHTLLASATSIITTLKTAYKARTLALNEVRADMAAQTDELDEVDTRARHLKIQLSDMSARMSDTEANLRAQLLEERQRREQLEKEKETGMWVARGTSLGSDSGFESDGEGDMSPISDRQSRPREGDMTMQQWDMIRKQATTALVGSGRDLLTENTALRQRVAELEGAVDACLQLM